MSQDEGNQSVSDRTEKSDKVRSKTLFITTSNKVIGDLGENMFSEVGGVEGRVQQDEDQIVEN